MMSADGAGTMPEGDMPEPSNDDGRRPDHKVPLMSMVGRSLRFGLVVVRRAPLQLAVIIGMVYLGRLIQSQYSADVYRASPPSSGVTPPPGAVLLTYPIEFAWWGLMVFASFRVALYVYDRPRTGAPVPGSRDGSTTSDEPAATEHQSPQLVLITASDVVGAIRSIWLLFIVAVIGVIFAVQVAQADETETVSAVAAVGFLTICGWAALGMVFVGAADRPSSSISRSMKAVGDRFGPALIATAVVVALVAGLWLIQTLVVNPVAASTGADWIDPVVRTVFTIVAGGMATGVPTALYRSVYPPQSIPPEHHSPHTAPSGDRPDVG